MVGSEAGSTKIQAGVAISERHARRNGAGNPGETSCGNPGETQRENPYETRRRDVVVYRIGVSRTGAWVSISRESRLWDM